MAALLGPHLKLCELMLSPVSHSQFVESDPQLYQVSTASYFFQHVNVVALPKRERKQMQLEEGSNCPLLAADMTEAGRILWKGIEGICNSNWTEIPAGSKSIPPKKLTAMVKTYVPTNFAVNYHHFYRDGLVAPCLRELFQWTLGGRPIAGD